MFQKLYRHLEEINTSLREDRTGMANQMGETIIGQLESMNTTLHRLQNQLANENNASVPAALNELNGRRSVWPTLLLPILAAVLIPLLIFMAFTLAQINRRVSNQAENGTLMTSGSIPTTTAVAGSTAASAVGSADMAENRLAVRTHLMKLDSLITEQEQALAELKKLNSTAVATMQRIRRHFTRSERPANVSLAMQIDSLAVAR